MDGFQVGRDPTPSVLLELLLGIPISYIHCKTFMMMNGPGLRYQIFHTVNFNFYQYFVQIYVPWDTPTRLDLASTRFSFMLSTRLQYFVVSDIIHPTATLEAYLAKRDVGLPLLAISLTPSHLHVPSKPAYSS